MFFFHVKTLFLTWTEQSRQAWYEVSPDYQNDDEEATALDRRGDAGAEEGRRRRGHLGSTRGKGSAGGRFSTTLRPANKERIRT